MTDSAFAGIMLGIPLGMVLTIVLGFGFFWGIQVINSWQWTRAFNARRGRRS